MKIITKKQEKKQEKEIEDLKRVNNFLSKGWRAMTIVLDYQRTIVAILETLGLSEIEIEDCLMYGTNNEIQVNRTINHTTKIRVVKVKE